MESMCMTDLVRLCRVEDVKEGEPFAAHIIGLPPLAIYKVDDGYFVTDNVCTHGNAMLTDGYQEGGTIECPFHGGAFDIRTGAATVFPCHIPLKTYEVSLTDGWITIVKPSGDA